MPRRKPPLDLFILRIDAAPDSTYYEITTLQDGSDPHLKVYMDDVRDPRNANVHQFMADWWPDETPPMWRTGEGVYVLFKLSLFDQRTI